MKCVQCQEGYRENNGECSGKLQYSTSFNFIAFYAEEIPEEENVDSDGLSAGTIFGIILAGAAGLLVLIIIIVAIVFGLRRQRSFSKTDG